jgi:tyrosyl-tRNA synthetase
MGGSDQWGNIVTGTELIRRKSAGEAFALTCPLMTKADGGKFGKTEKGNVWLDPRKTSPYQFYQFWLNAADADAEKYMKTFTLLDRQVIDALVTEHAAAPHLRTLQKRLAKEITCFVHGEDNYNFAVKASEILFSNDTTEILKQLNEEQLLQVMEGVPAVEYPKAELDAGIDIVSFLAATNVFPSKGEAKKMLTGGGVSINKQKVEGADTTVTADLLLNGKYLLVQKGRRNYYLVKAI